AETDRRGNQRLLRARVLLEEPGSAEKEPPARNQGEAAEHHARLPPGIFDQAAARRGCGTGTSEAEVDAGSRSPGQARDFCFSTLLSHNPALIGRFRATAMSSIAVRVRRTASAR